MLNGFQINAQKQLVSHTQIHLFAGLPKIYLFLLNFTAALAESLPLSSPPRFIDISGQSMKCHCYLHLVAWKSTFQFWADYTLQFLFYDLCLAEKPQTPILFFIDLRTSHLPTYVNHNIQALKSIKMSRHVNNLFVKEYNKLISYCYTFFLDLS